MMWIVEVKSDDDSDGDRDSEVEHYCCNEKIVIMKDNLKTYKRHMITDGIKNDEANHCGECAEEEIEKVDNEANNEISKKDVLDAYGVRPQIQALKVKKIKRINK